MTTADQARNRSGLDLPCSCVELNMGVALQLHREAARKASHLSDYPSEKKKTHPGTAFILLGSIRLESIYYLCVYGDL